MSKLNAVFGWAKILAPLVLANIQQTRAVAPLIPDLMDQAEALGHASGAQKLQHVTTLAHQIGETLNTAVPGKVDLTALDGAVASGINIAFNLAKVVADEHGAPHTAPPTATGA